MPQTIKIPIIPVSPTYYGRKESLDYEAICVFAATGFFLESDTYYKELKVLKPGYEYTFDENGNILKEIQWFKWHYAPSSRTFVQTVEEFAHIFEKIIDEKITNRKVILPLSGGIDSRTLACALKNLKKDVQAYSYKFKGGINETSYGKKIAHLCNFTFNNWEVKNSYLWEVIDQLAQINGCYSEFTHPRSMAFIDKYSDLGEIFCLGHGGNILMDDMNVNDNISNEEQINILLKNNVKKGGLELAKDLWNAFKLEGTFKEYFVERLRKIYSNIEISGSASKKIRAFKCMNWAPRWTAVNLVIFSHCRPIVVPYFDDRLCEFICTIPENYHKGRRIQIEYIKQRNQKLAKIAWQDHRPFNLVNYRYDKFPWNFPFRLLSKGKSCVNRIVGHRTIQRNWELQFLGDRNMENLKKHLLGNKYLFDYLPKELVHSYYEKFSTGSYSDKIFFSHPLSMLLTLSKFFKNHYNQEV